MDTVQGVYKQASLTYPVLGANGIKTIATEAVMVTRNFTTAEKMMAVSLLRQCVWSQLKVLQETEGTHGQWQNVEATDQIGSWPWYPGTKVQWPPQGGGTHR